MINKADLPGDLDTLWARVKADEQLSESEVRLVLSLAQRPGLLLLKLAPDDPRRLPGCWLGGEPTLPPEVEWPHFNEANLNIKVPMHFLAQINLAQLPRADYGITIPEFGTLFIFSDPIFAPLYQLGKSVPAMQAGLGARVIFVPGEVDHYPPRVAPDLPEAVRTKLDKLPFKNYVSHGYCEMLERGIMSASSLHKWPFRFVIIDTNPMDHPSFVGNEMKGRVGTWVDSAISRISTDYGSQAGPIGYVAGAAAYDMIRHSRYRKNDPDDSHWPVLSDDHVLVMVLASSEYTGFCHGEFRDLSFWIQNSELEKRNFDNLAVWEML